MKADYQVIASNEPTVLNAHVTAALNSGYSLAGSLVVSGETIYQAVVKIVKTNECG